MNEANKNKEEIGKVCYCDKPQCGKCLGVNCENNECPTHTKENKIKYRKNWEFQHNKKLPEVENY